MTLEHRFLSNGFSYPKLCNKNRIQNNLTIKISSYVCVMFFWELMQPSWLKWNVQPPSWCQTHNAQTIFCFTCRSSMMALILFSYMQFRPSWLELCLFVELAQILRLSVFLTTFSMFKVDFFRCVIWILAGFFFHSIRHLVIQMLLWLMKSESSVK